MSERSSEVVMTPSLMNHPNSSKNRTRGAVDCLGVIEKAAAFWPENCGCQKNAQYSSYFDRGERQPERRIGWQLPSWQVVVFVVVAYRLLDFGPGSRNPRLTIWARPRARKPASKTTKRNFKGVAHMPTKLTRRQAIALPAG